MDEIRTRYGYYDSDDLVYIEPNLSMWIVPKNDHKIWMLKSRGVPVFGLAHARERKNELPGNFGDIRILLWDWYNEPLPEDYELVPICGEPMCITQVHLRTKEIRNA